MQMNLIEANLAQRGTLPLPSAALVIDIRGNSQDDVIERLRVEITDLAGEMKAHKMNHWRFLTDFLSFRVIPPLRADDVEAIRSPQKPKNNGQKAAQKSNGASKPDQTPLMGPTGPAQHSPFGSRFQDDPANLISEGKPFDVFQQRVEEISQEIDRLRNNRIKAVNDVSKDGIAGHNVGDATVRVIFLTQSEDHESLLSASLYAAHLKEHIKKSERKGFQSLASTTVVCLDNKGEAGPPADIIHGLSWNNKWEHLDSLIVSEKYSDNAAFMAGAMQTYLAELLLYVLLIIPPLRLRQPIAPELTPDRQVEAKAGGSMPKGEWVTLPYHSYLVGLGSMEHSARWGRRWLNYCLVACAAEILHSRIADEEEVRRSRNVVSAWLSGWRERVEQAIPDKILGNIQPLQAIPNAINVAKSAQEAFTTSRFSLSFGESTVIDLESYLADVERTYNTQMNEQIKRLKETQDFAQTQHVASSPTLQDAVDSIPLIQERLRDWEDKDLTLKKGTPLINAQLEAQSILSNPNFFTGANGAVPRARIQLQELSSIIADFQNSYKQTTLNLMDRRADLNRKGRTLIDNLKKHIERIPLLGKVLHLATPMAFLTFIMAFCLIFFAVLFGFAWLRHLVFLRAPDSNFVVFLDAALNLNVSLTAFIVWAAIIALILAGLLIFGRTVLNKKRSAWAKEIIFWLGLLIFTFVGLLFSFSLGQFVNDPGSSAFLSWLSPLPYLSGFAAFIAIVMLVVEAFWFWRWIDYLMVQREQIISDLRTHHRKDVDEVSRYISGTVALQILQRTGLTDGNGGPSSYYSRVDQLNKRLNEISVQAKIQRDLAANRLALSLSETQPGAPKTSRPWLNLDIREEWLDVESLTAGFQRLSERLIKEVDELKEFSQLLLQMMGEETPIQIEQQLREKPFKGNREQRQMQILMATLAALVLRFSIAAPTVDSMTPIIERYDAIDSQYSHQLTALSLLIDTLRKRVRDFNLQPLLNASNPGANNQTLPPELARENILMATGAFATWTQMLWEGKDTRLDQALDRKGILSKLIESNQDPKAVMRRLFAHTMLFGRSHNESGEGFLLLSPSPESGDFRQNLNIPSRLIIDFPDPERLLLFYIQRYVREALFVPEPEPTPSTLRVSPDTITFDASIGIASQIVTIGNTGNEPLSWTAELDSGSPAFISLATLSGMNLAGGADTTLNVNINTTGITGASTFTASMTINAYDPQTGKAIIGSPVTIPITINVVPPTMQLSVTSLNFTATPGNNPPSQTVDITNTDSNTLTWTIDKPPQSWLTVSPSTGSEAPGDTSSAIFSVDGTDLTSGNYYANTTITPSLGAPATITVKLIV
jgi:BACON domain-containing protein